MKSKSQNVKRIFNFVEINGTGTVILNSHTLRDVMVFGYFKMYHWYFIVHSDIDYPDCYSVSEASTGCIIGDYCYDSIEEALSKTTEMITEKRYYLFTLVNNVLVKTQKNLLRRNLGLTLAIESLWI